MKKLALLLTFIMFVGLLPIVANEAVVEEAVVIEHELAPMNKEAYIEVFIEEGILPDEPTQEEIEAAFAKEFANVIAKDEKTRADKEREKKVREVLKEKGLPSINSEKLGKSNAKAIALPEIEEGDGYGVSKTVKILALLIEFPEATHNNIEPVSPRSYHTADFDKDHYQNLLFGSEKYVTPEGVESHTMTTYYLEQSNGTFLVTGDAMGWYTAKYPAEYYGSDVDDVRGNDAAPRDLVVEAINAAVAAGVDLSSYDQFNNFSYEDGPDGIVDHLMIIHAGLGQEEGGGALGTDAIWSHSWDLDMPHILDIESNTIAYNYTIEPENGAIGVMVHEFAHDLGIPDDYDTIYSGDGDIVEAWSLMAGGSWTGEVGGTKPVGINPWGRAILGSIHGNKDYPWTNFGYIPYDDFEGQLSLATNSFKTDALQSVIFELPAYEKVATVPIQGEKAFWGGTGAVIDHTMDISFEVAPNSDLNLSYKLWYDIEEAWDAGFVQVALSDGPFVSLSTPNTVTFENPDGYPDIMDSLPAYTGQSNGWLEESINLRDFIGDFAGNVTLRFRYATDWGTENPGMFVDQIAVVENDIVIFEDDAESGTTEAFYPVDGWISATGKTAVGHRYMIEWRSHLNADEGLTEVGGANFDYNQGMLVWYINDGYENNWVGVHPGYGRIGVIDATQHVYFNKGYGSGNEYGSKAGYMPFVQLKDAAFSVDKTPKTDLSYYSWAGTSNLPGKNGVSLFSDRDTYIDFRSPFSGLFTFPYGLDIKVLGNAEDYSQGLIEIDIVD